MFQKTNPSSVVPNMEIPTTAPKIFPELSKNNKLDFDYVLKIFKVNFEKNNTKFIFSKEEKNDLKSSLDSKLSKNQSRKYQVLKNGTIRSISKDDVICYNKQEIKQDEGIRMLWHELNKQEMRLKSRDGNSKPLSNRHYNIKKDNKSPIHLNSNSNLYSKGKSDGPNGFISDKNKAINNLANGINNQQILNLTGNNFSSNNFNNFNNLASCLKTINTKVVKKVRTSHSYSNLSNTNNVNNAYNTNNINGFNTLNGLNNTNYKNKERKGPLPSIIECK